MSTEIAETIVSQKAKELCQALLADPGLVSARKSINAFLADNKAQSQYEQLMAKGHALQTKQQNGEKLNGQEIADFESERDSLLANPIARNFLDAQEQIHEVQQSVVKQISKTLELGRIPDATDLEDGCCGGGGGGCGCHH